MAATDAPKYYAGNDPQWQKLKKVALECQPFKDGAATMVCVRCFRLLAFPSAASKIQCGACNAVCSHVQAKCMSCAFSMKIPLGSSEVQCPNCLFTFKPMAKMRVLVPEVIANTVPPPVALKIVIAPSVGACATAAFDSRVINSKPLSANIAGWELASGASFQRVKMSLGDKALDAARTPAELQLKSGDVVTISAGASAKTASASSSGHDFQSAQFNAPTNCAVCREFIWGVYHQGRKCVRCGITAHHRCAEEVRSMCDAARRQLFGIVDFGGDADSDDDNAGGGEDDAKDAVIAVPIEDPAAFMAACREEVPPECDAGAMDQMSQLAKFTDEQIAAMWAKYDADSSGVLEKGEALRFLADVVTSFGTAMNPADPKDALVLSRLLRRLDTNENGVVEWDEFYLFFQAQKDVAYLQQFAGAKADFTTEQLYAMWAKYDVDGSGDLTVDEVLALLGDITQTDAKSLTDPKTKKNKLASFLKSGQKVTWDMFYESFVPIIQAAVRKAKA